MVATTTEHMNLSAVCFVLNQEFPMVATATDLNTRQYRRTRQLASRGFH